MAKTSSKSLLQQNTASFQELVAKRMSRRAFLKMGSASVAGASLMACSAPSDSQKHQAGKGFESVPQGLDENLTLPEDYDYQVVMRWGDPLFSDSVAFKPGRQTGAEQARQFGFNNDYVGFLPLPLGSNSSDHGLLTINHEHTKGRMMHSGITEDIQLNKAQTEVDIAAHGLSVIEVKKDKGGWHFVKGSKYTRRITPNTPMHITGPVQGSPMLNTLDSRDGVNTKGTYGNCAGGVTPWGTILTAEENIDKYFTGDIDALPQRDNFKRYDFSGEAEKSWSKYFPRWDLNKNPNEAFHMGWIVEIDPYDPQSIPKKRTGLGRFKHEGCNVQIAPDGRVVAYSGDDEKFEYVYRFISRDKYQPGNDSEARVHNMQLLEHGTLYVAKFEEHGSLQWQPLQFGTGPLTRQNGFTSQADVLLNTRKAADLMGATPMDRPEDVDINPVSGKVYVMLTKNDSRKPGDLNGPNPRAFNTGGQVVELIAPDNDHTADKFQWDIFVLAGKPGEMVTHYHPETDENGWFATPDNCAFDDQGDVWITTDGAEDFGVADGVWKVIAEGTQRGLSQRFMRAPIGAEVCGPCFTPDNQTFFCAIQHPGNDSTFYNPDTRWPDFDPDLPPRPALIAITRKNGGKIGV